MFKLILCVIIIISSASIGFYYSDSLIKRKIILESFVVELKNCSTIIRYNSSSLSKVFENNFMNYVFNEHRSFSDQWCEMLKLYKNVLKSEDIRILTDFSKNLGTLDLCGEVTNIELYIEMLKSQIKDAESEINVKSKLYKTLGMSFGLAFVILII